MYPPIHKKPRSSYSFERLDMLWERYPQFHERTTFSTLEALLEEHESYQKDFDELREEYEAGQYEQFLVQLSWADLSYRYATKELIRARAINASEETGTPGKIDAPGKTDAPGAGAAAGTATPAPNPYVRRASSLSFLSSRRCASGRRPSTR